MVSDKMHLKDSETQKVKENLIKFKEDKKRDQKFVGVVLPLDVYNRLESIARVEDRKISQLVRLAIRRYLKERQDAEVKE
ncbi:MAG: hypothetical protein NZ929_06520 [Aigarchaeota archaeon]|nr:hypothetical protein [Aigarchaeota archaeon]MCX8192408.1 hypothetical protein [Nitrososphaeria archaeon]MDW7986614.1 hypothetical protein [Nitrososphaerota archaeon]